MMHKLCGFLWWRTGLNPSLHPDYYNITLPFIIETSSKSSYCFNYSLSSIHLNGFLVNYRKIRPYLLLNQICFSPQEFFPLEERKQFDTSYIRKVTEAFTPNRRLKDPIRGIIQEHPKCILQQVELGGQYTWLVISKSHV